MIVLGNFSQVGGHMNFSVHEKYKGSSAYLQVPFYFILFYILII